MDHTAPQNRSHALPPLRLTDNLLSNIRIQFCRHKPPEVADSIRIIIERELKSLLAFVSESKKQINMHREEEEEKEKEENAFVEKLQRMYTFTDTITPHRFTAHIHTFTEEHAYIENVHGHIARHAKTWDAVSTTIHRRAINKTTLLAVPSTIDDARRHCWYREVRGVDTDTDR